jgi:S1-C subfamily serine protease
MTDETQEPAPTGDAPDYLTMSGPMDQPPYDEAPTEPTPPAPAIPAMPVVDPSPFNPAYPTAPTPWPPTVNAPQPTVPAWGSAPQGWPPPAPPLGPDTGYQPGPPSGMSAPGMAGPGPGSSGPGMPPPPGGSWNYSYGPASWGPPPGSSPPPAAARRAIAAVAVLVLVLASAGVGAAISSAVHSNDTASTSFPNSNGSQNNNGFGNLGNGNSRSGNGAQAPSAIVAKVVPGVVDIYTTISSGGNSGEAAGTGMIISSSGEVLTNNHVIDGATSIRVEVVNNGESHAAKVIGYDVVDDVALLKMDNVSGLSTVSFADAASVAIGDSVVAIGNAQGRGGTPAATAGSVTALDQKVTAGDEGTGNSETLHGMIQMSAPIEPGDSGGPLANTDGKVVGMNTAAAQSDNFFGQSASSTAFAIPINKALDVVNQIKSGNDTNTVHIGDRGILGVDISQAGLPAGGTSGAVIAQVQPNSPADSAGL